MRPQPMIMVADVQASSRFYRAVLGATSGHGGDEYERLLVDGRLVLQLHVVAADHQHGMARDPGAPAGNGVALWFTADPFDAAVQRVRDSAAEVVADVHVSPNSRHREIWLRDPDGYLIVFSEPLSWAPDE